MLFAEKTELLKKTFKVVTTDYYLKEHLVTAKFSMLKKSVFSWY